MLLHDPERLLRLLTNPQRPVQLIIAGKAHPADLDGQALIQQWIHFTRQPEARPASDYTARLIPHHDSVSLPLEIDRILWQK